jgi:hypothetical protein
MPIELIAFWTSLFALFLGVGSILLAVRRVTELLYPTTAGVQSDLQALLGNHPAGAMKTSSIFLSVIGVALIIVRLLPELSVNFLFDLGLAWVLVVVGSPLLGRSEERKPSPKARDTVAAVKQLFEAAGYKVVTSPRTGDEEIDPLLENAPDLYAQRGDHAFAIDVEARPEADDAASWDSLDELVSAAWALCKYRESSVGTQAGEVEPLLAFVGSQPPPAARIYRTRRQLRLLPLDPDVVDLLQRTTDRRARRKLALDYLRAHGAIGAWAGEP